MLSLDVTDILSAFSDEKVEYMVVGGYAIAFYGYVRGTGDIDLWVRVSNENVVKIWRALKKFGAPLFDLEMMIYGHPEWYFKWEFHRTESTSSTKSRVLILTKHGSTVLMFSTRT